MERQFLVRHLFAKPLLKQAFALRLAFFSRLHQLIRNLINGRGEIIMIVQRCATAGGGRKHTMELTYFPNTDEVRHIHRPVRFLNTIIVLELHHLLGRLPVRHLFHRSRLELRKLVVGQHLEGSADGNDDLFVFGDRVRQKFVLIDVLVPPHMIEIANPHDCAARQRFDKGNQCRGGFRLGGCIADKRFQIREYIEGVQTNNVWP